MKTYYFSDDEQVFPLSIWLDNQAPAAHDSWQIYDIYGPAGRIFVLELDDSFLTDHNLLCMTLKFNFVQDIELI